MDSVKARINEIKFLEFCTRILAFRNKMLDIKVFIGCLAKFFEFDVSKISEISEIIFSPTFKVNKDELFTLVDEGILDNKELANCYEKSTRTIYRYKEKAEDAVLYPRLNSEDQEALDQFITQYEKLFTINYKNLFDLKGE